MQSQMCIRDRYKSAAQAAEQTGGKVMAGDTNVTELSDSILASAVKCYNAAVQRQLYEFFTAGSWSTQNAGQTERVGICLLYTSRCV